jgi:hypothetical protein
VSTKPSIARLDSSIVLVVVLFRTLVRHGIISALVPVTIWIFCTWPGQMNPDSTIHWDEALSKKYSNWFPVSYSLIVGIGQFIGNYSPAPVVIFQGICLIASAAYLVCILTPSLLRRNLVLMAFFSWPQTGGQLTLIGKETLFVASFLGLTASLIQVKRRGPNWVSLLVIGITALALSIVRWNGPIVVSFLSAYLILVRRNRNFNVLAVMALSLFLGIGILLFPPFSDNAGGKALRVSGHTVDIAWSLRSDYNNFSHNDLKLLEKIAPLDSWALSQSNCNNAAMPLLYDVFAESPTAQDLISDNRENIRNIWVENTFRHPLTFLAGRICKMKGLLVPAKEWWPSYSSPSQQVFEYRYNVTPFPPLSTRGASFAARLLDSWGASLIGQISAMPLFWLLLLLIRARIKGLIRSEFSIILLSGSSVIASIFIGGVGLEPRYVFPTVAIFFLYFVTMHSCLAARFNLVLNVKPKENFNRMNCRKLFWRARQESNLQPFDP